MPLIDLEDDLKGLVDSCAQIYERDSNLLAATWFDALGYNQKAYDDKFIFYNSESLLASKDLLEHFSHDNKKALSEKNIEFLCKKGKEGNSHNQDNFFCITAGKNKIFGVFDGHGPNGHLASSFAMGAMIDFIQNSKRFKEKPLHEMSDLEIRQALRKTFRFAQDRIKEQYRDYLYDMKKRRFGGDAKSKHGRVHEEGGYADEEPHTAGIDRDADGADYDVDGAAGRGGDGAADDRSLDSDEREFLDNVSWDTDSDEEDILADEALCQDISRRLQATRKG